MQNARTVVIGRRADEINRLLFILTYFIRCGEVAELNDAQLKLATADIQTNAESRVRPSCKEKKQFFNLKMFQPPRRRSRRQFK